MILLLNLLMEEIKSKERGRCVVDTTREEEDMISNLPDALISKVLSYLPTEEAVRTSVLSSRWKSLWLFISAIDLDTCTFPGGPHAFVSFMEKFLDSSSRVEKPCLHKVKLTTVEDDITRWIDFVATPELEHLDFECKPVVSGTLMPLRLYTAVPQCLLSSLEFVEIASTFGGLPAEMKLVRYFAETQWSSRNFLCV